jgi:imidazolonepropionase-like amidohydrolase
MSATPALSATAGFTLRAAKAWTGPDGFVTNARIAVHHGRITSVRSGEDADADEGAAVIDLGDATLIPGLTDVHVHPSELWASPADLGVTRDDIRRIGSRATLMSGVTTARIHLARAEEIDPYKAMSDGVEAPRFVVAGPGLLAGAPTVQSPLMAGFASVDDAIAQMKIARAKGAAWQALHDIRHLDKAAAKRIAASAQQLGLRIMAACERSEDLAIAKWLQAESLEYILLDGDYPEVFAQTARPFYSIPIGYYRALASWRQRSAAFDEATLRKFWPDAQADILIGTLRTRLATEPATTREERIATLESRFLERVRSGATVALSSDSGSLGQFHGDAIWTEVQAWRDLGLDTDTVLKAACYTSARALGFSDCGTLAPGQRADIVAIAGDISTGTVGARRVIAVFKAGRRAP